MDKATANKILKSATLKLKKQFGDDVFLDTVNAKNIPSISTGSLLIDKDTGIGGFPMGRISEIFGVQNFI